MCSVCHQTPCHPQCPYAPELPAVYECKRCGESIVVGDEYYEMDGDYYHEECFEDNALELLLKSSDVTKGTAEEDDGYEY